MGIPKARSTSSEGMTREPTAAEAPAMMAGTLFLETVCSGREGLTSGAGELLSFRAARTAEKLAVRSLRPEPSSPAPLADSTVRRKLTQAMESRIPFPIRSTSSPGIATELPAEKSADLRRAEIGRAHV